MLLRLLSHIKILKLTKEPDRFPDTLKNTQKKATPGYKKGSKRQCSNYRLISLLSNID